MSYSHDWVKDDRDWTRIVIGRSHSLQINKNPVNTSGLYTLKLGVKVTEYTMGSDGCAAVWAAKTVSGLTGTEITPGNIAQEKSFFTNEGDLKWNNVAKRYGLSFIDSGVKSHEEVANYVKVLTNELNHATGIGVRVNLSNGGGNHYVGTEGIVNYKGRDYYVIDPTSRFDNPDKNGDFNSLRDGMLYVNGRRLVPVEMVDRAVGYSREVTPGEQLDNKIRKKNNLGPYSHQNAVSSNQDSNSANHPASTVDTDPVGE